MLLSSLWWGRNLHCGRHSVEVWCSTLVKPTEFAVQNRITKSQGGYSPRCHQESRTSVHLSTSSPSKVPWTVAHADMLDQRQVEDALIFVPVSGVHTVEHVICCTHCRRIHFKDRPTPITAPECQNAARHHHQLREPSLKGPKQPLHLITRLQSPQETMNAARALFALSNGRVTLKHPLSAFLVHIQYVCYVKRIERALILHVG